MEELAVMESFEEGFRGVFEEREKGVEGRRRLRLDLGIGRKEEDIAKAESIRGVFGKRERERQR